MIRPDSRSRSPHQTWPRPTRTTVRTEVGEEFAYLLEAYSSVVHLPDEPPQTVTGHSLAVFEKQDDGSWKIDALVVNRDPR